MIVFGSYQFYFRNIFCLPLLIFLFIFKFLFLFLVCLVILFSNIFNFVLCDLIDLLFPWFYHLFSSVLLCLFFCLLAIFFHCSFFETKFVCWCCINNSYLFLLFLVSLILFLFYKLLLLIAVVDDSDGDGDVDDNKQQQNWATFSTRIAVFFRRCCSSLNSYTWNKWQNQKPKNRNKEEGRRKRESTHKICTFFTLIFSVCTLYRFNLFSPLLFFIYILFSVPLFLSSFY